MTKRHRAWSRSHPYGVTLVDHGQQLTGNHAPSRRTDKVMIWEASN
ncbi:MAG: hypothetical protein SFV15_10590 [Polyangiaceae bacterium]|nr:hypothetical protein [Polyangiaceae bacterium]